jgi:hypothetical protein
LERDEARLIAPNIAKLRLPQIRLHDLRHSHASGDTGGPQQTGDKVKRIR